MFDAIVYVHNITLNNQHKKRMLFLIKIRYNKKRPTFETV